MCIELGEQLAAVARDRLAGNPSLKIIAGGFDTWRPPVVVKFDADVAATAWHWIDPAVGRGGRRPSHRAARAAAMSGWAKHRMMTSGGMTAALDRLERKGLVARVPNPADRRGILVRLTDTGRDVIDEAMTQHVLTEQRLVSGLDEHERAQLRVVLRRLLHAVDTA